MGDEIVGNMSQITATPKGQSKTTSKMHVNINVNNKDTNKALAASTPKQRFASDGEDHVRFKSKPVKEIRMTVQSPSSTNKIAKHQSSLAQQSETQKRRSKQSFPSMTSLRRTSLLNREPRKCLKLMNTYKLYSDNPFNVDKVQSILVQVLTELITEDMIYDAEICQMKALETSNTIRARVKEEEFERYKLICVVTIGEKKSHDIMSCAKFLWDSERDRYATYMHENMRIFAVATVFALYYE